MRRKAADTAVRESKKRMESLNPKILKNRANCLPNYVSKNKTHISYKGPFSGGSLPRKMLSLSDGIERKVILDRRGQPLLEMVKIPAGEFFMGSLVNDNLAYDDEKPQRHLYLDAYWIARTPVTNRMWKRFLEESNYQAESDAHDEDYLKHWKNTEPPTDKLDHPVVYVSYLDAWAFCDFYGLVLPSEAQWEKAARGTDGRIYPWGNQEPTEELCNFSMNVGDTTIVGAYPKGISPFGLADCAGNIWELCADVYDEDWLKKITQENLVNISKDCVNSFACRGGAFDDFIYILRSACRGSPFDEYPGGCYDSIGFRPAHNSMD